MKRLLPWICFHRRYTWSAWWQYKKSTIEICDYEVNCQFNRFDAVGISRKRDIVRAVHVVIAIWNAPNGNTTDDNSSSIGAVDDGLIEVGTCR